MLRKIARDITYEFFGNALEVDAYFVYDGRPIRIISGQFMGTYGISNHWHWKEVLPNGDLSANEETGYGGDESVFKPISREQAISLARGKVGMVPTHNIHKED